MSDDIASFQGQIDSPRGRDAVRAASSVSAAVGAAATHAAQTATFASPISRRRHLRIPVTIPTKMRHAVDVRTSHEAEARVVDVSEGGARIEVVPPLQPGEWVTVEFPTKQEDLRKGFKIPVSAAGAQRLGIPTGKMRGKVRAGAQHLPDGRYALGVVFQKGFWGSLRYWLNEAMPTIALLILIVLLFPVAQLKQTSVIYFWYHPILYSYGLVVSLYIVSRLAVAVAYRAPPDNGFTPSVTVIVACKNEESSIRRTLQCIFRSDYPEEKLHVIAVDDGSTDGTLREMRAAAREYEGLQIVSFERNLGKRHAMAEGARLSAADVLVYVDSDSFLRRDSIRKIVTVFADADVGAVSGHARVHNAQVNALTKMQEVRYYLAFRILKAAESVFGCVTCCSGCFAAYRRSAVMDVLPSWTRQKFLGVAANFGDDRALTRFILKRYRVVYHADAICSTIVPESWRVFFRQQLRWKKSWVRENGYCSAFMWKRHPVMVVSFYLGVIIPLVSPAIVLIAVILPVFGIGAFGFLYVYGAVLMATLYALVYLARHRNSTWVYGIWFSFFYMAALVWMTYYAIFTLRKTHWGTR